MTGASWYVITLHGCDDTTEIEIELTPDAAALIERIRDASHQTSTYACMPVLEIESGRLDTYDDEQELEQ